jgi:hypothetical protein
MATLTVGELKALLADPETGVTDDMIVILASDAEGNSFRPVPASEDNVIYAFCTGYYDPEEGDLLTEPDETDRRDTETVANWEWALANGQKCLCLFPGY